MLFMLTYRGASIIIFKRVRKLKKCLTSLVLISSRLNTSRNGPQNQKLSGGPE